MFGRKKILSDVEIDDLLELLGDAVHTIEDARAEKIKAQGLAGEFQAGGEALRDRCVALEEENGGLRFEIKDKREALDDAARILEQQRTEIHDREEENRGLRFDIASRKRIDTEGARMRGLEDANAILRDQIKHLQERNSVLVREGPRPKTGRCKSCGTTARPFGFGHEAYCPYARK